MGNTKQYATLVTAGEVIDKTFTNKNTDPVLVSENTIVLSELAHIRPLLGEKFYAELKLQHDTGTLSVDNQAFMTYYLEDTLSWSESEKREYVGNLKSAGLGNRMPRNANSADLAKLAQIALRDAYVHKVMTGNVPSSKVLKELVSSARDFV